MKNLRQFCAVSLLTLMLTLTVLAGQIETGIAPPPPPTPKTAMAQGGIETGVTTAGEISTPLIAEVALNVLQSVLSLF